MTPEQIIEGKAEDAINKIPADKLGGSDEFRQWITLDRKPSPASLMYHAFEQGMHAGIVGYNHKKDCPYAKNDYRMWWMHGCIVGNDRRAATDYARRLVRLKEIAPRIAGILKDNFYWNEARELLEPLTWRDG